MKIETKLWGECCVEQKPASRSSLFANSERWDSQFLDLAAHIAQWSKDQSTKVGAVIVRPNRTIVSLGYNGFPKGADDAIANREVKLLRTIHAVKRASVRVPGVEVGKSEAGELLVKVDWPEIAHESHS